MTDILIDGKEIEKLDLTFDYLNRKLWIEAITKNGYKISREMKLSEKRG